MKWKKIEDFPDYSVSNTGLVRNDKTDRLITLTRNGSAVIQVGLMKEGLQHKRGVALLVAKAFLTPHPHQAFSTPINLDGDRSNNSIENLMWRPRWFAMKYHKQFSNDKRGFDEPIMDTKTGERFETSFEAATKYGLIDLEIFLATLNRTYVWPTYQEFRVI